MVDMIECSGSFFRDLNRRYGYRIVAELKDWIKLDKKRASLCNRRIFLLECRRNKLTPRHISQNIKCLNEVVMDINCPIMKKADKLLNKFKRSVINIEIEATIWQLTRIQRRLVDIKYNSRKSLPPDVFADFELRSYNNYDKLFRKIRKSNVKKIEELKRKQKVTHIDGSVVDEFLFNYTSLEIPIDVAHTLSMGPNFGINELKHEFSIPRVLKDFEYCIRGITSSDDIKNTLRAQATNIITNHYRNPKNFRGDYMVKNFKETRRFLEDNPDILVMRSDKGNSTVIMYRDEYVDSMYSLLSDVTMYRVLNKDPTLTVQSFANCLLDKLHT
ncbi:uncharacterized protein LOC123317735 [Coccinella septempunctata]|uniref:uncharacterized protein LOC123317735 n=1 Tax=Coccinella septempunctata TaxID=41139 RepID=UPI001D06D371|nr:uncharacterized protein LOC123317735 [Coccinella septempunctata]